jgi:ComF family protein
MMISNNYLKKILSATIRCFFPHTCVLCGYPAKRTQDLCQPCLDDLPILAHSCPRCANNFTASLELLCGSCLKENPPFDYTHALFSYESPISNLITELKFQHNLVNAKVLGELMAEAIENKWYQHKSLPDIIIPMPLHNTRLKERGFNQALEIARPIAKRLHLPLDLTSKRIKFTQAQTTLQVKARAKNMKNAFYIDPSFTYQHVAILDDVITTGQTVTALSKALKQAGVHKIDIWCCAKVIKNGY